MTIFNTSDVSHSCDNYVAALAKFKEAYGFDHDGIGVIGFADYDEAAAYNKDMADDASLLSSWDCYLFTEEGACTYDEYVAACKDGTVVEKYLA